MIWRAKAKAALSPARLCARRNHGCPDVLALEPGGWGQFEVKIAEMKEQVERYRIMVERTNESDPFLHGSDMRAFRSEWLDNYRKSVYIEHGTVDADASRSETPISEGSWI